MGNRQVSSVLAEILHHVGKETRYYFVDDLNTSRRE